MSTMNCNEFSDQLELWMEGSRDASAQAHLRSCSACQSLVSDMEAIQSTARSWEAEESPEPPARIWASLRLQLEAERLIHEPASSEIPFAIPATQDRRIPQERTNWLDSLFAGMARPAMAGAYLMALIAAGFAFSGLGNQQGSGDRWNSLTQVTTVPLRSQLDNVEHTVFSLSAANSLETASLRKNLDIVDKYIVLCEKSVNEEPGNEIARDYLYTAYQQKADLLAQMTEDGDVR